MDEVKNEEDIAIAPAPKKRGRPKKEVQETPDGNILIYMQYGVGWATGSGVEFSEDHPYQLVHNDEAIYLLQEERFRKATIDEVKDYYSG